MMTPHPGITGAAETISGGPWHVWGHTCLPKSLTPTTFAWFAAIPQGAAVPAHYHVAQDEFAYVLDGRLDVVVGASKGSATSADLITLPMGVPHAVSNVSDRTAYVLFWVSPAGTMHDLLEAADGIVDAGELSRLAARHGIYIVAP